MIKTGALGPKPAHDVALSTLGVCSIAIAEGVPPNVPSIFYRISSYLLLSGAKLTASRQRLGSVFWPEADAENASANLRQGLARIRRLQDENGFRLIDSNFTLVYLVPDGIKWDLRDLLKALAENDEASVTRACELYAGDLLADIGPSSEEFEDWLLDERARLRNLFIDKVTSGLNGNIKLSAAARSQCARHLLKADPCNELAFQVLMTEAAQHGDYTRLHKLFQKYERQLMEELGVRGSPGTRGLYQELTRGQG